jgi:hypothetical protein
MLKIGAFWDIASCIVQVPALKPWKECGKYDIGGGNDAQRPVDWL